MICSTARARKAGTRARLFTEAISSKEKNMARGDSNGKMAVSMREISLMDSFKDMVNISLQI